MSLVTLLISAVVAAAQAQPVETRSPHELRKAVHAALRATAPSAHPQADVAVPRLVKLFDEVRASDRMSFKDRRRYQGLLRSRLQDFAHKLEKQIDAKAPASVVLPPHRARLGGVLAQQANNAQGGGQGNVVQCNVAAGRDVTSDNARQLVELIETTIAPTTWERAGGPGVIRYYRPRRVLVIRQTGGIHDQLGALLGGLQK